MESEGVPIPSVSSSPPLVPTSDDHPDVSPTGSPDLSDLDCHQQPPAPPSSDQPPAVLTDELRDMIIKQVEYFFSDENLLSDTYLMTYVKKDKGGYVPIGVVASFRKMKKLTKDVSLIATALRESSLLVVSANGWKVKRLHPLPAEDPRLCTVVVENLPNDHSLENLQRIFGEAGKVQKIVIRDPHDARDSRKLTSTEKLLTTKLHALVEYDTLEAAERAVSSLNNKQDWRYGLRVKLLKKKKKIKTEGKDEVKVDARKKVCQEVDDEKNSTGQATNLVVEEENHSSSEHHYDSLDEEEGRIPKERRREHTLKDKTGEHQQKDNYGCRNRNRGPGKRQQYNGTNGHWHSHGHGTPPNSHHLGRGHGTPPNSHHFEPSKPPPGPKMPDGTRGFTLGRGRPLQSNQS